MTDPLDDDQARQLLFRERYPRSNAYPPELALGAWGGPNSLWSAESVAELLDLRPGMRVLDLACGKGASSVFLAREYGVRVCAIDRHIPPDETWARARAHGVEDLVTPMKGDARELRFPRGYFDAVVCIGAYMYFGTDDMFLVQFLPVLRQGARVGAVMHGLTRELAEAPDDLLPLWRPSFACLHGPAWWEAHMRRSGAVRVLHADMVPEGWRDWADWNDVVVANQPANRGVLDPETAALRADGGDRFGLVRLVYEVG